VRETLTRNGDPAACATSRPDDTVPPAECGAIIRIEVVPLVEAKQAPPIQAVTPPAPEPFPAPTRVANEPLPLAEAPAPFSAPPPIEPAPPRVPLGTQKILGLVAGGVGIAGIAVGGALGMMAFGQKTQQQSDCGTPATCTHAGQSQAFNDRSTGLTDSAISTVAFIAGGAMLVGGVVLFVTGPSPKQPVTGLLVAPSVGPGGGGLSLAGGF